MMQHFAVNLANGNYDFFGFNFVQWRSREVVPGNPYADGRWRFLLDDLDGAWLNATGHEQYSLLGRPHVRAFTDTNPYLRERFTNTISDVITGSHEAVRVLREFEFWQNQLTPTIMHNQGARFPTPSAENQRNALSGASRNILIREAMLMQYLAEPNLIATQNRSDRMQVPAGWSFVPLNVRVNDATMGTVHVNTITGHDFGHASFTGRYFNTLTQTLEAHPRPRYEFVRWQITAGDAEFVRGTDRYSEIAQIQLSDRGAHIVAIFEYTGIAPAPLAPRANLASGTEIMNRNIPLTLTRATADDADAAIMFRIIDTETGTELIAETVYTTTIAPFALVNPSDFPNITVEAWTVREGIESVETTRVELVWYDLGGTLITGLLYTAPHANMAAYPSNQGISASTLEFFYASGARAMLGRPAGDRAAINVPNNAGGWWPVDENDIDANNSAGWVITLDTRGFEDIRFTASQGASNNGPSEFGLAWRLGTTGDWTSFASDSEYVSYLSDILTNEIGYDGVSRTGLTFFNVELPSEMWGEEVVQLRVYIAGTRPRGTGDLTRTSGNASINNIMFHGTQTGELPPPAAPIANLENEAVIEDTTTELILTTATPNAQIWFRIIDENDNEIVGNTMYTAAIRPFELVNPSDHRVITIETWSVRDGVESSMTSITLNWEEADDTTVIAAFEYTHGNNPNPGINLPNFAGRPTANVPQMHYGATGGILSDGVELRFVNNAGAARLIGRADADRPVINAPNDNQNWWNAAADGNPNDLPGWIISGIDTTGFENITFSAYQSSTDAAPRDWRIAYRIGSTGDFTAIGDVASLSLPRDVLRPTFANIQLPAAVNNQQNVYLKIFVASNITLDERPANLGNGGNTSINNIIIRGDEIGGNNETPQYWIDVAEGFVRNGDNVTVNFRARAANANTAAIGILAVYENYRLVEVRITPLTGTQNVSAPVAFNANRRYRAFIWNSIETLSPAVLGAQFDTSIFAVRLDNLGSEF